LPPERRAATVECMGVKPNPWLGITADGLVRQIERPPDDFEKIRDAYSKED
jgi:hypothetical protein